MYSRLHFLIHFLVAFTIGVASLLAAQAQSPAPVAGSIGTATLHGHIADPTGALIPGAQVKITNALGVALKTTTSDAGGAYSVTGLAPGNYIVQTAVAGFAPFTSPTLQLAVGQSKRVDIAMAIEAAQQNVVVSDDEDTPTVSVDAGSNANTIVIKGKDLDALSDDPDELSNELQALAGPSAGPNGGQIYIDGFTGGTLPPKSAIREIRINSNPFSAEFDHIGYGRIEIFTKPGTDVLHGRGFLQGNDNAFNTGNPFTAVIPPYHSIQYNGTISGSINKKSSFFLSVEGRNNQDANIYTTYYPLLNTATGQYAVPTSPTISGGLFTPQTRIEISPRLDLQLGLKNTLTLRYQYERTSSSGNLGSNIALPTEATNETSSENSLQLLDSQIINEHIVNETRFQYRRAITNTTPVNTTPTVGVGGYFSSGGFGGQTNDDHTDHLELQNITTMSAGAHAIKFGTWMRDNRDANTTNGNFNGSFSFSSLTSYVTMLNGLAPNGTIPAATIAAGGLPIKLTYTTGKEAFLGNVFDAAVFFQDDWKFNQFLTLSGGLRWEGQNHVADHSDWGPRVAFAYALDGHKKGAVTKTVLRGGYGFFYDRFQVGSLMTLERYNGGPNSQSQVVINNPTCFSATSLNAALAQPNTNCNAGAAVAKQIDQVSSTYRSPYMEQFGTSLERQLTKVSTLTLTYVNSFGVHQMDSRNSNAYLPGTYKFCVPSSTVACPALPARPNPSLGIVDEMYPEAVFKEHQLIASLNARFTPNFSVSGFYNLSFANGDTGTASNSYNLSQDYGRASFVRRNMLFLMGNYTGPWAITFNPFLIAQSGKPFNITTENDLTGDNFFNDRPSYATSSSPAGDVVATSLGNLDTVPQPGETIIPSELGTGPAAVAMNLRVSRSFGIGPKVVSANGSGGPPPPGGSSSGGGSHGSHGGGGSGSFGGFGGPFGSGGGSSGMHGGMSNTGRKYSLTFSAQALNLFNDIDYGTPSGVVTPTACSATTGLCSPGNSFGRSTSLAGGIYASPTGSAARRIYFQASFSF